MKLIREELYEFTDSEIGLAFHIRNDLHSANECMDALNDAIAILDGKECKDIYNAGGIHELLTQVLRYIANDMPRCCGDALGYVLSRDGMLVPFDGMMIADRGDRFLPSLHEHFSFYEKIVDADEFANFR